VPQSLQSCSPWPSSRAISAAFCHVDFDPRRKGKPVTQLPLIILIYFQLKHPDRRAYTFLTVVLVFGIVETFRFARHPP
jgi:hypothetical protein